MWALGIQTTKLVTPENSLKFKVLHDKYMDQIFLQLEDITKPGKKETTTQKLQICQFYWQNQKEKVAQKEKWLNK